MSPPKNSYWLRSGLFSIFEKGSVFVFGFGTMLILFRILTMEQMGAWGIFLAVTSFLEVGLIGLIQNATVKYLTTAEEKDYGKISTASLFLNFSLTAIFSILIFFTAHQIGAYFNVEAAAELFKVYSITLFLLIPFYQFNFTQQANLDFKGIFWSNFGRKGIFFLIVFGAFVANYDIGLLDLAWLQIIAALLGSIIAYIFAKRYLRFNWKLEFKWVAELFYFGVFVCGTNLSTMLYKNIDRLMLGRLIGPSAVAIYEAAIKVTNLIEVPSMSVASVVFPQGAKQAKDGKQAVRNLYEKSVGAIFALILPFILFISIFPEFIIRIIATEEYIEAVPILRLTILFGLFLPFAIQFGTVLDSIGKPKINFVFTIIGAFLNAFFNWFFISKYGIIGAAYGTLTTYILTFFGNQILLYKMFGVKAHNSFYYAYDFYIQAFNMAKGYLGKKNNLIESKTEV